MKRIFAAFLAVLCLVSAFLLPISAAESFSDALYRELRQLVKVEDFLLNEKDNGVYLLSVVESGYGEKGFDSNGGSLYLYFYNPSGKVVKPSVLNGVTMATKWDDDGVPTDYNDQGDPVYILHYAVSDTYFVDEYFVGELDENGEIDDISDSKCFSVEQDVYLDFDVIYMTFGNDPAELTTIGVVMSPQDGFADVYSPPGGDKDDNKLKMILALILGLVGIVLVLWLVSQVVSFVNAAGQASYQREAKKYYKNKNKYHRRR